MEQEVPGFSCFMHLERVYTWREWRPLIGGCECEANMGESDDNNLVSRSSKRERGGTWK